MFCLLLGTINVNVKVRYVTGVMISHFVRTIVARMAFEIQNSET